MLKQKLIAFLYHFLLSLLLMLIAGYLIFGVWYHKPYYQLFDVLQVFILMLGIDLILGPLLTFIVYKKGKKTLKMDLAVVALVQLLAFGWGMWSIANARPAWIVMTKGNAYAISPAYLKNPENKLQVKAPSVFEQNWLKPKLVMLPNNNTDEKKIYQTNAYQPYDVKQALANKLPMTRIESYDKAFYDKVKAQYPQAVGYYMIVTEASMDLPLLLIDEQGQPIDTVVAKNKVITHKK